jgi:hypothetical protein
MRAIRSASLLRTSILDWAARASPPAGLKSFIQIMCQLGAAQYSHIFQYVGDFASHQMDANSCLFERHKLKPYAANHDA